MLTDAEHHAHPHLECPVAIPGLFVGTQIPLETLATDGASKTAGLADAVGVTWST